MNFKYNENNIAKLYNPVLRFSYIQPCVAPFNILYHSFPLQNIHLIGPTSPYRSFILYTYCCFTS